MSVTLLSRCDSLHAFASLSSLQQLLLQWLFRSCLKHATYMMAKSTCSCSCDCFSGIHGCSNCSNEAVTRTTKAVTAADEAMTTTTKAVTAANEAITTTTKAVTAANEAVITATEAVTRALHDSRQWLVSRPAIALSKLDFPQPEGPTMSRELPACRVRFRLWQRWRPPAGVNRVRPRRVSPACGLCTRCIWDELAVSCKRAAAHRLPIMNAVCMMSLLCHARELQQTDF